MTRALLSLCLLALGATSAAASPAIEARFFDQLARRAFAARDYPRAVESFLFAYELAPTPGTLYNILLAAELSGDHGEAYVYGETYLAAEDEDQGRRRDAERRMSKLRRTLALVRATSDPPGATLYVDRRELGVHGRTPRTLVVEPGAHTIVIEREGYEIERREVTAVRGEELTVEATLRPVLGVIRVVATPIAADVTYSREGAEVSIGRASTPVSLPIGRYEARITADGYRAVSREVVVRQGEEDALRVTLQEALVPSGRLLVRTGGTRAAVLVDGRVRGFTPLVLERLVVGRHRVVVRAPGMRDVVRDIVTEEGRSTTLELELFQEVE